MSSSDDPLSPSWMMNQPMILTWSVDALPGQLKGFTGIDDPYEEPEKAELVIEAAGSDGRLRRPEDQAKQILAFLRSKGYLSAPTS